LTACYLRQIKRLIINIPPRYLKSNLVTVGFPTWVWIKKPSERFMTASYSASLALKHSEDRRTIMSSAWYQKGFGDRWNIVKDTTAVMENDKRGRMEACSILGSATGKGGNFLLVDDPHDIDKSRSDIIRQHEIDAFNKKFTTRLDDKENGVIIIIMQRLHEADLSGYLLSSLDGDKYDLLKIPGENDTGSSIAYSFPMSGKVKVFKNEEILHPQREDRAALKKQRGKLGSFGFSGQYLQEPSPREGGIFKKKYWGRYNHIPINPDGTLDFDEIVDVWDCSFKDLKTSDFVAGGVIGVKGAFRYLLHVTYAQMGFLATMRGMLRHRQLFLHPKKSDHAEENRLSYIEKTIIEDKANGTAIIETLKLEVQGIIAFEPHGSKEERAAAIEPQLESGCWLLPVKEIATFDVELFIDNLAKFPNAKNDDLVDMTTMAGIYLKKSTADVDVG
jgi:predicted phage terminase large subunit-like protein